MGDRGRPREIMGDPHSTRDDPLGHLVDDFERDLPRDQLKIYDWQIRGDVPRHRLVWHRYSLRVVVWESVERGGACVRGRSTVSARAEWTPLVPPSPGLASDS